LEIWVIFGLDSFLELVNCFFSCYFDSKGLLFINDPAVKEVEVGGGHSEFWGVEGWTIVLKPLSLSTTAEHPSARQRGTRVIGGT